MLDGDMQHLLVGAWIRNEEESRKKALGKSCHWGWKSPAWNKEGRADGLCLAAALPAIRS